MTTERLTTKCRKIPRTSSVRPLILFPSFKNKRHVYCESYLERSYLINLEYAPTVIEYSTQPASYSYINRLNKRTRYTPDCFVSYESEHQAFVEVKPYSKAITVTAQEKFQWLNDVLMEFEKRPLIVVTCRDIKPNKLNLNRDMLYQYLSLANSKELSDSVMPFVESHSTFSMKQFEFWTRRYLGKRELAWTFLAQNLARFDKAQTERLTKQTILEMK